ncbi:hypothetical protein DBR23_27460, partial [Acidovorax sp. HMWF018]
MELVAGGEDLGAAHAGGAARQGAALHPHLGRQCRRQGLQVDVGPHAPEMVHAVEHGLGHERCHG